MFDALYSGASTLDVLAQQQDMIASNLAHLNTPGHRRTLASFAERMKEASGGAATDASRRPGTKLDTKTFDFTAGRLESTGRKLDLSIKGDGFFAFQGPDGEVYSRDGVVFRTPDGQLVNRAGFPLLGDGGPINVSPAAPMNDIVIGSDGTVSVGSQTSGKIKVVSFENPSLLTSDSGIMFQQGGATIKNDAQYTIHQGTRELSNAHPVTELVSLIVGSRHYESAQRAIRAISDVLQENMQQR